MDLGSPIQRFGGTLRTWQLCQGGLVPSWALFAPYSNAKPIFINILADAEEDEDRAWAVDVRYCWWCWLVEVLVSCPLKTTWLWCSRKLIVLGRNSYKSINSVLFIRGDGEIRFCFNSYEFFSNKFPTLPSLSTFYRGMERGFIENSLEAVLMRKLKIRSGMVNEVQEENYK